jgi:discs large protein 5
LRLNGDTSEGDSSSNRRSSSSYRRSFFKRIKQQRGSSRDSKELASFSNTHLSLYLEPAVNDDGSVSYQRVERLDCKEKSFYLNIVAIKKILFLDPFRPVLVIGPLTELVVEKLVNDFPDQFHRCIINQMRCSKEEIEMRLNNNLIIEYRCRGSLYECVSLEAAKDNKVRN